MSKPDLAAIRARDRRGALGLSLLRIADEGLLDRKALLAYVYELETQIERVRTALEAFDSDKITGHEFANRVARALGGRR